MLDTLASWCDDGAYCLRGQARGDRHRSADLTNWADAQGRHPTGLAPAGRGPYPGALVERHPAECANGHPLIHPNVQLRWLPCDCQPYRGRHSDGHRVVMCWTCWHCWYLPAHGGSSDDETVRPARIGCPD